jgi:hypothetical protein
VCKAPTVITRRLCRPGPGEGGWRERGGGATGDVDGWPGRAGHAAALQWHGEEAAHVAAREWREGARPEAGQRRAVLVAGARVGVDGFVCGGIKASVAVAAWPQLCFRRCVLLSSWLFRAPSGLRFQFRWSWEKSYAWYCALHLTLFFFCFANSHPT